MTGCGIETGMTPPHPGAFIRVAAGARQGPGDRVSRADLKKWRRFRIARNFFRSTSWCLLSPPVTPRGDMRPQEVDSMQEITLPDRLTSLAVRFKSPFQGHGIREGGGDAERRKRPGRGASSPRCRERQPRLEGRDGRRSGSAGRGRRDAACPLARTPDRARAVRPAGSRQRQCAAGEGGARPIGDPRP